MKVNEKSHAVETVLAAFKPFISNTNIDINKIGIELPLPLFNERIFTALCEETVLLLQKRSSLIHIDAPVYVVGDIHGNILDLIRIFLLAQTPPFSRFLFLGDYVDRGSCSLCVVSLLFAMQLAFPDHVFLLRGNHEFESINSSYGFYDEVMFYYGNIEIFTQINKTFEYLPIAAIIRNEIFCVHGGLSPNLKSFSQIEAIQRPFKSYENDFVADLLWSDPVLTNTSYIRSRRGSGVTFGPDEVSAFLEQFKMKIIIRAHQCVRQGVLKFGETELYTVFSSSSYDEGTKNSCGLMFFSTDLTMKCFSLPAITQLSRETAVFEEFVYVKPVERVESQKSRPVTFNVKLKEISRLPQSSIGIKLKAVSGFKSMFGKTITRSPSIEALLPPLSSTQK
jgi:serine/threonine-protein phosphatase PP1 catalytic subunit